MAAPSNACRPILFRTKSVFVFFVDVIFSPVVRRRPLVSYVLNSYCSRMMEPMHNGGHKRDTCHDTANACRTRRGHCNNTCARRDSPPSISNSSDCGPALPLPSSSLLALTPPPQHQHPCIHTLGFWKMTSFAAVSYIA